MPACRALTRLLDGRLLSPSPKRFGSSTPIADSTEAMTPWPEVTVDDGVRREKVLCLVARLEALHLPLPPSRRPMRVLGAVIQIAAGPVFDVGRWARRATP